MVLRWLTSPVRLAWRWLAHQPRAIQIGLVLVVLAAVGTGAYYGRTFVKKRLAARDVGAAWAEYGNAVRRADMDEIGAVLDRVLTVSPGDETATRYKAMLASGEADPEVQELAVILLHHHIRNDRLAEAAREGEKVLTKNPKNWQCALRGGASRAAGQEGSGS